MNVKPLTKYRSQKGRVTPVRAASPAPAEPPRIFLFLPPNEARRFGLKEGDRDPVLGATVVIIKPISCW